MANTYAKHLRTPTPQSEPLEGMVKNSAGGYAYAVDKWARLDRFLILGSEGGTYYIDERSLTNQNLDNVKACIAEDGRRVVDRIVEISDQGRAPKNTPALLALAMCSAFGAESTRERAYDNLDKVARTGYHLFMWANYTNALQGTGMGWRKAVANWYNSKQVDQLAYQLIKYQQREGWSNRDLLRLAHPKPSTHLHVAAYEWAVGKFNPNHAYPELIWAHEAAKTADKTRILELIDKYNLPRESIPTNWLNDKDIWEHLLAKMPLTAMIRNLGKMTSIGLIAPLSNATNTVTAKINDEAYLRRSRVHPLNILVAQKTYHNGKGLKGSLSWIPVSQVTDALDAAFYKAFRNVEPTGENYLLAVDVSGSMASSHINNMPLTCREASATLALVTAATEPNYHIIAFSDGTKSGGWAHNDTTVPLDISPRMRLPEVIAKISKMGFCRTDCAQPMLYAMKNNLHVDKFIVYTDSETWHGHVHPSEAMKKYRKQFRPSAKSVVVGMVANNFSIADPNDPGMLDVVGFDTTVPQVISSF